MNLMYLISQKKTRHKNSDAWYYWYAIAIVKISADILPTKISLCHLLILAAWTNKLKDFWDEPTDLCQIKSFSLVFISPYTLNSVLKTEIC